MKQAFHTTVRGAVRPMYDFVLVERLPDEQGGLVAAPDRKTFEPALRRGRVVAVGPGDGLFLVFCRSCYLMRTRKHDAASLGRCAECGRKEAFLSRDAAQRLFPGCRCEMNCALGDVVLYPRVPANDVRIDEREYTFLHEEQHVYAILDAAAEHLKYLEAA